MTLNDLGRHRNMLKETGDWRISRDPENQKNNRINSERRSKLNCLLKILRNGNRDGSKNIVIISM